MPSSRGLCVHVLARFIRKTRGRKRYTSLDDGDSKWSNPSFEKIGAPSDRSDGWAAVADIVRQRDEQQIQDCKEDMDGLFVFVSVRDLSILDAHSEIYVLCRLAFSQLFLLLLLSNPIRICNKTRATS